MKKADKTIIVIAFIAILVFVSISIALLSSKNAAGYIFIILAAICYTVLIASR